MELVERPVFFPELTIQGRAGGPVVDTGCEHPGGRIYLDRMEAQEVARHYGFITPEEGRRLHAALEQANVRIAALEAIIRGIAENVAEAALRV